MDEKEWWISVSERIARIDERTKQIQEELKSVGPMRDRLTAVEQRSKSNTHRLDDMYKWAMLLAAVASILANIGVACVKYIVGW
jgi:hypothetical protein